VPGSHVETGPVRARCLITVRDGRVGPEVSAFVVRREPSAWLAVPRVLVGVAIGTIVGTIVDHLIILLLVDGTGRGTLVHALVSRGTQLVPPGYTLRAPSAMS
jgi:hypothetical protein